MAYTLENIHKYGYDPIGDLKDMIREAITQLATNGMTRKEIAEVMGMNRNTVAQYIIQYDIPITERRSPFVKKRKLADRTVEEFQTLLKTNSLEEIADEWDTNMVTLRNWRKEKGLMVSRRGITSK